MDAWAFAAAAGAALVGALVLAARRPAWIVRWPHQVLILTAAISVGATVALGLPEEGQVDGIPRSRLISIEAGGQERERTERQIYSPIFRERHRALRSRQGNPP